MRDRVGWLAVLTILASVGCTEYLGPPASPEYWRPPPAEQPEDPSDPGPQTVVPPGPVPVDLRPEPAPAVLTTPERPRPRSISLGYTDDRVLSGGVTRDSPTEPRAVNPYAYQSWQSYANAPKWRSAGPQFQNASAAETRYGVPAGRYGYFGPGMGVGPSCSCNCGQVRY